MCYIPAEIVRNCYNKSRTLYPDLLVGSYEESTGAWIKTCPFS